MVNLLPSQATRQIAIYAAEVPSTITIEAPNDAYEDATFQVTGKLTRADSGAGIADKPVKLYSGTTLLATANTSATGNYLFNVSIATPGTYTLKAEFEGAEVTGYIKRVLGSSAKATIGKASLETLKPYVIPAVAVVVAAYLLKKM